MQRISRAPELSATLSLDSCWINRASPPPSKRKRAVIPAQPASARAGAPPPGRAGGARLPALLGALGSRARRPRLAGRPRTLPLSPLLGRQLLDGLGGDVLGHRLLGCGLLLRSSLVVCG